ncbi:MAG: hypothetical protein Kow0069_11170 [Promethearchaeota archaeon]
MPVGLVVSKWSKKMGVVQVAAHPPEAAGDAKAQATFLQLFGQHQATEEPGIITMLVGSVNYMSFYTGADTNHMVTLVLRYDEDPDQYEDGLESIASQVVQNLEGEAFKHILPSLYHWISQYPSLELEQRLALMLTDEVKRAILTLLRSEGSIIKTELGSLLKDRLGGERIELDLVLNNLVKYELVKVSSAKGLPSDLVQLVSDLMVLRVPPLKIFQECTSMGLPEELVKRYKWELKSFFGEYRPSNEDELKLLDVLANPAAYTVLKLLRTSIITRNELEKLRKKGVDDVEGVLSLLEGADVVVRLTLAGGGDREYIALKSNPVVKRFFPRYVIDVVRANQREGRKSPAELLEYLQQLELAYFASTAKK